MPAKYVGCPTNQKFGIVRQFDRGSWIGRVIDLDAVEPLPDRTRSATARYRVELVHPNNRISYPNSYDAAGTSFARDGRRAIKAAYAYVSRQAALEDAAVGSR